MGDRSIKKEVKKKKKTEVSVSVSSTVSKPIMTQPELIKKEKKKK